MKLAATLSAALAASLLALGHAHAADKTMNLKEFFGNFHTNPGNEVAIPFIKTNDANLDGYPESVTISFRVYAAGTTTLLNTSAPKIIPTPAIPSGCSPLPTPGNYFSFDWDLLPARRGALLNDVAAFIDESTRMHIAVNMSLECWNGADNAESMTGAVYSGNLSGVAGTGNPIASWVKNYPGKQVVGLNGVDRTGDLVNDAVMITTATETSLGDNLTVIFVNGGDGTNIVDLPPATYALTR